MNSRERVRCAIDLCPPDRIPLTHATLPGAVARYGAQLDDLYRCYPADVEMVGAASEGEYGSHVGEISLDSWRAGWVRHTGEHKGQVVHHPLRDWDRLSHFVPPDTAGEAVRVQIETRLVASGDRYTLADGDTLWQRMFYLHGYQETLQDLLLEPERCAELRDMIVEVMARRVEMLCRLPRLDGIHFRDDWGTQQALMIAPALWRAFFKPAYARLLGLVRAAGKDAWFHSDGAIAAILPDLIELGVQVLNPQVPLIGRARLAALCKGRACIEADIDRQGVLPFGTPAEVRAAVRADIEAFDGRHGGYIGRGEIAGDVPLENALALFDEITNYR